jgi:hypothetical protein
MGREKAQTPATVAALVHKKVRRLIIVRLRLKFTVGRLRAAIAAALR